MKVDSEVISPVRRRVKVLVPEEVVRKELDEAYSILKKRAEIKGFRKGKAPRSILERFYKDQVESDVITKLIKDTYQKAIDELSINPVSQPIIEEEVKIKPGEDFHYSAIVEVKPSFEVKGYLDLVIEEKDESITDEDVSKRLEEIRTTHSYLKEIEEERPLKEGDFALVDFEGQIDGKPFSGGIGKDQIIEITKGVKEEDLAERLIGMKRGEIRDVEVKFPSDYPEKELAGRMVNFRVSLKGIKEKIRPELNDQFARDVGNFNSLEELKEKIRNDLLLAKKKEVQAHYRKEILRQLVEKNPIEVPEALVDERIKTSLALTEYRLARQGIKMESINLDDPGFIEELRVSSKRAVQEELILEAISNLENIEVTEEDLNKALDEISIYSGEDIEKVRQRYYNNEERIKSLKLKIIEDKTLDFLIARAKIIRKDTKN